jgi:Arc/MetJ-type ribon-helix-helix transcriptional regulator
MINAILHGMKVAKSFTYDEDILAAIEATRNGRSASECVNDLLRRALKAERYAQLEREAETFFANPETSEEAAERKAFHDAAIRSLAED